jgi:hypothetical protein
LGDNEQHVQQAATLRTADLHMYARRRPYQIRLTRDRWLLLLLLRRSCA